MKSMPPDLPAAFFSESSGIRHLHLGSEDWIQGSMRIRKPFDIELEYVQRMMAWLLFVDPATVSQRHAMQLGLGAGAITKFCFKRLGMRSTAVELNPEVVAICRGWFSLPPDGPLLNVQLADAQRVASDPARAMTVDALAVDIYDDEAASPVLDSPEIYADCWRLLTEDGVMTVNLFGRNARFSVSLARIAEGFGIPATASRENARLWSFSPTREGNTVVLALRSATVPDQDTLVRRAEIVESRWGLPARKWLRSLKPVTDLAKPGSARGQGMRGATVQPGE